MGKLDEAKREARLKALGLRGKLPEAITERVLEAVRTHPQGERYALADGEVPGLALTVRPDGGAAWQLAYRTQDGTRRLLGLGAAGKAAVDQVRALARARLVEVGGGGDPAAERAQARAERARASTVRAYLAEVYSPEVLAHKRDGGHPATEEDKPSGTHARILSAWGPLLELGLADVTRERIEKVLSDRKRQEKAIGTLLRDWAAFRALLSDAVDRKCLAAVPMSKRPMPIRGAKGAQRVRWLGQHDTEEEIAANEGERKRFFDALDEHTSNEAGGGDFLRFVSRLALATGMRRQEIVTLREAAINWRDRTISLRAADTKTAADRIVHLSDDAIAALKTWKIRGTRGELFPGERERWEDRITQREWPELCAAAEIADLHFHDLRHHFAVTLRKAGAPLEVVREALGHKSIVQTEKYAHVGPSEVRDAVRGVRA